MYSVRLWVPEFVFIFVCIKYVVFWCVKIVMIQSILFAFSQMMLERNLLKFRVFSAWFIQVVQPGPSSGICAEVEGLISVKNAQFRDNLGIQENTV